jgi:hypothetical protein
MADERENEYETEQENAAAAEAGAIGGRVSSEPPTEYEGSLSEADRPVSESGGGESEGFELAEMELIEHASHGDQHSAAAAFSCSVSYSFSRSSAIVAPFWVVRE